MRDPANSVVFTQTLTLGDLNPRGQRSGNTPQTLSAAILGNYTVNAVLFDGNDVEYARASTHYKVIAPPAMPNPDLKGDVSVSQPLIQRGDAQHRHDTVRNLGAAIPTLKVARVLVEDISGNVVARVEDTVSLAAGGSRSWPLNPVPTGSLSEGDYTAALLAEDAAGWRALSVAPFTVKGLKAPGPGGTAQPIPATSPALLLLMACLPTLLTFLFTRQKN